MIDRCQVAGAAGLPYTDVSSRTQLPERNRRSIKLSDAPASNAWRRVQAPC